MIELPSNGEGQRSQTRWDRDYDPSKLALHFGVMGSLKLYFMGVFGTHVGISRITFSEYKFRALSELFRSLSITSRLVDGQKLRRLSWNGWKSVFSRGRTFSHFFSPFLLFLTPCFQIKALHRNYVLFKGDWTTLQQRGSTEPNSLRYDPSKLAPKLLSVSDHPCSIDKQGIMVQLLYSITVL